MISDGLADNFSILPGHHGSGDNEDDGAGDGGDGGAGAGAGQRDGGARKSRTFAMFERPTDSARQGNRATAGAHERREGGRAREAALSLSVSVCVCPPPTLAEERQTLLLCSLTLMGAADTPTDVPGEYPGVLPSCPVQTRRPVATRDPGQTRASRATRPRCLTSVTSLIAGSHIR